MVDDYLAGAGVPLTGPALLNFDALKHVLNLKGLEAGAVDLAAAVKGHVLALAAGPHFRGGHRRPGPGGLRGPRSGPRLPPSLVW